MFMISLSLNSEIDGNRESEKQRKWREMTRVEINDSPSLQSSQLCRERKERGW